jgi:hypothetical protein
VAAKSPVRRSISSKAAAIERHNPDDPRLGPLRVAGAALAIAEIGAWARQAAAALPEFDQAEIAAAGRAAAAIDARLARKAEAGQ